MKIIGWVAVASAMLAASVAFADPAPDRQYAPGETFKDCPDCPEMVVVPAGSFMMGSPEHEEGRTYFEGPQHRVTFSQPFAIGKYAVTFDEWNACVADRGCNGHRPSDLNWGQGKRPVVNVSWDDAQAYVAWLRRKTGGDYHLPSEAQREYVTRAGTTTPFWWGSTITNDQANYTEDGEQKGQFRYKTAPVDAFQPNPWGLFQVHGNVFEWTADCWNNDYSGAPTDGSARSGDDCASRVTRGGSWETFPRYLRSAYRDRYIAVNRSTHYGFRVARKL